MTELQEVAEEIADRLTLPWPITLDQARQIAREQMPDETPTVIDGVAEALVRHPKNHTRKEH